MTTSKTCCVLIFLSIPLILAQQKTNLDFITEAAGKEFEAGSFHTFLFGNHWRDLWSEPINFPKLDLNNFAGGLTPTKIGGGLQTKSLHFIGANGKKYKFRSIRKDVSRSLPPDFEGSTLDNAMQDQISVMNPVSAIIVAELMDAVGILNAKPFLCYLPYDEILGEYRDEFSGMIGTIEENPDDYENEELNFAGANKIVNTFSLFKKLQEDNDEVIDAAEFLKARLMDVLVGDRDRHAGQWDWAGYKIGKKRIWKPIPKDRDYAFPLYDGLIPTVMTIALPSIVHFGYDMPSMIDITWEGRHLDRRLLSSLDKTAWDSVALFMQNNITDDIIVNAVKQMPPEYFNLEGEHLISKLKSRRDQLVEAAEEHYLWVSKYVDIYCSNKNEVAEVIRENNLLTSVSIFKRDKKSGKKKGNALYARTFHNTITEDIRIHLQGGDDIATVTGEVDEGCRIIIVGGEGKDELIDQSKVNGYFSLFLPIPDAENKTEFYDSGKKTILEEGPSTYINRDEYKFPEDPELRYEPDIEDRYRDYSVLLPWAYDNDDGLIFGAGLKVNYYDFRMKPFDYSLELSASYSTISERPEIEFLGDFYDLIGGMNIKIPFRYSGLDIARFYGFGNETERIDSLVDIGYYNVNQRYIGTGFFLDLPITKTFSIQSGLLLEYSIVSKREDRFLHTINPYGVGGVDFFAISTSFTYDNRDHKELPYTGYFLKLYGDVYPNTLNNPDFFGKVAFDGRTYLSTDFITHSTLALRLYGEAVWGDYPFFKAATVGGKHTLRGFPRDRFVGDFSILTNIELRMYLAKVYFLIPFKLGLNLFTDTGRVYLKGENSDRWHNSFGGGLWISIQERLINVSLNFAKSPETFRAYFALSQMF